MSPGGPKMSTDLSTTLELVGRMTRAGDKFTEQSYALGRSGDAIECAKAEGRAEGMMLAVTYVTKAACGDDFDAIAGAMDNGSEVLAYLRTLDPLAEADR